LNQESTRERKIIPYISIEDSKTNSELSFKKQKDTLILKNPSSEDKILLKSTAKDNKTSLLSSSSHLKLVNLKLMILGEKRSMQEY